MRTTTLASVILVLSAILPIASKAQLKLHPDKRFTFGTVLPSPHWDDFIYIETPTTNYKGIYIKAHYDTDWRQSIVAEVDRDNAVSYVVKRTGVSPDKFYVLGTGTIYAAGQYYISDLSLKENIQPIGDALSKVLKLNGVRYNFNESFYGSESRLETGEKIGDYYKKPQIGFIAQDVEKIVPEAVVTTKDGIKALAYQNLAALLVEAIKTQNRRIDSLEALLKIHVGAESIEPVGNYKGSDSSNEPRNKEEFLYQNSPNPFNQETVIKYSILPQSSDNYYIAIYSIKGREMLRLNIDNDSEHVTLSASQLEPGSYVYGLMKNGRMIDSAMLIVVN